MTHKQAANENGCSVDLAKYLLGGYIEFGSCFSDVRVVRVGRVVSIKDFHQGINN